MRNWLLGLMMGAAGMMVAFSLAPMRAAGQAPAATAQAYTPPRTPDGQPDFRGYWQAMTTAEWDVEPHAAMAGAPAGLGIVEGNQIPYLPAALATKRENFSKRATADPTSGRCMIAGTPRIMYMPYPFQITQTPDHIAMLFEYDHHTRIIYTNGTKHPEDLETHIGDSRGRWEGNTLVVDVRNFNDQTWFDRAGNFHTEALHIVERYTRISPDVISYEATIEDPKVFSRPWKISTPLYRHQERNFRVLEYECHALVEEDAQQRSVPLNPEWYLR